MLGRQPLGRASGGELDLQRPVQDAVHASRLPFELLTVWVEWCGRPDLAQQDQSFCSRA